MSGGPGGRPGGSSRFGTDGVTILHVSDPQFGAHHRFGDSEHDSLAGRLLQALESLTTELPAIDIVMVSGDITETGLPQEFAEARSFVDRLCASLSLPAGRVVVVPGNHDVNWKLCSSYFDEQEGNGLTAEPPFAKKWAPYEAFVTALHGVDAFSPDRPYRVQLFDDLGVAVAALNSTIAESHRDEDHYGLCGEDQLRWFAGELAQYDGYLRIGVVHHNVRRKAELDEENLRDEPALTRILGPHLDLVLHGHTHDGKRDHLSDGTLVLATGSAALKERRRPQEVPNQCQVLKVRSELLTRWALCYQPNDDRWVGDTSLSASGDRWREEIPFDLTGMLRAPSHPMEPPSRRRHEAARFLEEVAELTGLRDGVRKVAVREKGGFDYLAVFADSGEMWAVGVVDRGLDEAMIDAFCEHVHLPIRSRGSGVRSELVHTGRADERLRRVAARQGVTVKTWTEYQNLLDLSSYEDSLRHRLASDDLYPQDLYLPQRYRFLHQEGVADAQVEDDLADTVLDEVLSDACRFILVLGDPGFGKSFLIHRLTHLLLEGGSGIIPIVVLLRDVEKHHSLEEMVAPALISTSANIQRDRFQRMFGGGRVVALIDGYDEFAVRAGYDRAADQLRTFLRALHGKAKIVLTTRPSHFRSREQVVSQVFEDVMVLDAQKRRIYELEAFDDQQQRAFLHRWFERESTPDPVTAAAVWMDALASVDNLPELARTPRMLSFMAQRLDLDQVRSAGRDDGPMTAAALYEMLVDTWLKAETDKFGDDRVGAGDEHQLSKDDRWRVMTELAYRLWVTGEANVTEAMLATVATSVLDLPGLGMSVAQAVQEVGSRTLLVGDDDQRYFTHHSIYEFVLARKLAEILEVSEQPTELGQAELPELTARFLRDLAPAAATRWLRTLAERPE